VIRRIVSRTVLALALTNAGVAPGIADEAAPTDANLVTAIDVSGSIDSYAEKLELAGMADAIEHPAVLQAIGSGLHGRIGFVAFTWSSQGDFVELVPWTMIGSSADARRVADRLRAVQAVPRMAHLKPWRAGPRRPWRRSLATDISAALEHALLVLAATPFHAERSVVNICANGQDNIDEEPDRMRDRAAAAGVTINAVALGRHDDVAAYLRQHVQTGAGSFVIEAQELSDITDVMLRKFVVEIAWPLLAPARSG
jgi:hypothetical protein